MYCYYFMQTVSFGPKNQVPHVVKSYDPYVYSVNVVIWVNISNEATSSACFPYAFCKQMHAHLSRAYTTRVYMLLHA